MSKKRGPQKVLPPLPELDLDLVEACEDYLQTEHDMKRPPVLAARLLALIIQLDREGREMDTRVKVAEALGGSVFGVDAAISVAMARGLITLELKTTVGTKIKQRDSIIRHRYFHATQKLLDGAEVPRRARRVAA